MVSNKGWKSHLGRIEIVSFWGDSGWIRPWRHSPGAPSFALFAKGGMPLLCTRSPSPAYWSFPTFRKEREGWERIPREAQMLLPAVAAMGHPGSDYLAPWVGEAGGQLCC